MPGNHVSIQPNSAAMDLLSNLTKAQESRYFKPEQEEAVLRIRHALQRKGTLQSGVAKSVSNSTLAEILAHEVPLNLDKKLTEIRNKKEFISSARKRNAFQGMLEDLTRTTYIDKMALGSSLGTGRGKFSAATLAGEASLFNVADAQKLILNDSAAIKSDRLAHTFARRPDPVLELGGVPIKLFPEPTAGRALFWGTVLAAWIGAGTAIYAVKALDIRSVDDVKEKFQAAMRPVGENVREYAAPFAEKVHSSESIDASAFANTLKSTISK